MAELDLGALRLHYTDSGGTGAPVLLLAGMMSDHASWAPLVPLLAPHHRLICPDNRTTGQSRPAVVEASVPLCAEDALRLLDALGLERVAVVGHSLGGMIAMELAARAPERVTALGLLASAPLRLARNLHLFRLLLELRAPGQRPDLWLDALFPWLFSPAAFDSPEALAAAKQAARDYPHAQSAEAMAAQLKALEAYAPEGVAARVRAPTLALLAAGDLLMPEALARAALAPLARTQVEALPGAGHSIHWDAPEAVAQRLLPFLARHAAASTGAAQG